MIKAQEHFMRQVQRQLDGCWIWTGRLYRNGYGVGIVYRGRRDSAHRHSWFLFRGEIPEGMHVLHKCDVRACVNPGHLYLGSHEDNMRDRSVRGRTGGTPKLTRDAVREIKRRLAGGADEHELAKEFGVKWRAIRNIKTGYTWRQV